MTTAVVIPYKCKLSHLRPRITYFFTIFGKNRAKLRMAKTKKGVEKWPKSILSNQTLFLGKIRKNFFLHFSQKKGVFDPPFSPDGIPQKILNFFTQKIAVAHRIQTRPHLGQ